MWWFDNIMYKLLGHTGYVEEINNHMGLKIKGIPCLACHILTKASIT